MAANPKQTIHEITRNLMKQINSGTETAGARKRAQVQSSAAGKNRSLDHTPAGIELSTRLLPQAVLYRAVFISSHLFLRANLDRRGGCFSWFRVLPFPHPFGQRVPRPFHLA